MRIDQITTLNQKLAFRNDVKLSHYRKPENEQLVGNYQFSARNIEGYTSTVDLLGLLCRAVTDRSENRFIFEATYGKGKSHFALALANFFGKAEAAPETQTILETVGHVSSDSRVGVFRDFKTHYKPFMTVLIDGVGPGSLRDKFFRAFDEALKDNEATAGVTPPFWFDKALTYLDNIKPEDRPRADAFLEPSRLDVSLLRDSVARGESRYYELCHGLVRELSGVRPDFGSETSLGDALGWVTRELCGEGKPLGGVLVLFDEFSLFVQEYGRQPGGALQELLNGIEDNRGEVLFVALTQMQPESMIQDDGSSGVQSLHKELNRIPQNNRLNLQSSLEDVLREFFREDDDAWYDLLRTPGVGTQVSEASEAALEAFKTYYPQREGWDAEEFQKSITKECFPLHPLTTVLLARVPLRRASTTRSVIGYLIDAEGEVMQKMEQEAVENGRVNWVLPISLIDYFADMLNEDIWAQYENVKVPDLSAAQSKVLKAMVLQQVGNLQTKNIGFERVIGQLAGLSPSESKEALEALEQGRYIRRDEANRTYAFWAGSNGAVELERLVNKQMEALHTQGKLTAAINDVGDDAPKATKLLTAEGLALTHEVSVKWGSPEDWAAHEIILSRAGLTQRNLVHLLATCRATTSDYAKRRGVIITLLAENQGDVIFYENELKELLDSTEPLRSAPFVVMQPKNPEPELVRSLLKYTVLSDATFAEKVISEIGKQVFDEEKARLKKQLEKGLQKLRAEAQLVVSQDARGQVQRVSAFQNSARRLEDTLKELYGVIYYSAPEEFFGQYKHASNPQLRAAVMSLVPVLENNNVVNAVLTNKVSKDIVDKFLGRSWGFLNRQRQLQVPTAPRTGAAWTYLDKRFIEGETVPVGEALKPLLNAPYGYDFNTLTLLFASWYGLNRRDLELYVNGRVATLERLTQAGRGKPDDFVGTLGACQLRRRKRSDLLQKVRDAVERVETGGLTRDEANRILDRLKRFTDEEESADARLGEDAKSARAKLEDAFVRLEEYEQLAASIDKGLQGAKTITAFGQQLRQLDRLPALFTILSALPSPDDIRKNLMAQTQAFVERQSETNERLASEMNYGLHQSRLKELKKELERLSLSGLEARVDQALLNLEGALGGARKRTGEDQATREIKQIGDRGIGLAALEANRKRLEPFLAEGTERVQAAAREKLANLEQEARRLRDFMVKLPTEIDKVTSARAASDLREKVVRQQHFYEGTRDYDDLESDRENLKHLEEAFTELEKPINLVSAREIVKRQETLRAFESLGGQVKEKVLGKLSELDKARAQKEATLSERLAKLYNARNLQDVTQSETGFREFQNFFAGTEHEADIDTGLTKVATFKQFFGDLRRVEEAPHKTPADFAESKRALEAVRDSYRVHLGDAQLSALDSRLVQLDGSLGTRTDEATAWLRELQNKTASALNVGQLNDLQRRLEAPPAFLPESLYNEAEALQDEIETKLDGLALADIEYRFKGLPGDQRAACLERLQRLMRELEPA